jgi:hypothetical protein
MPYQAIRDCLPPGHSVRRRVLYTWLLFLLTTLLVPATLVALVGAHFVGVILALVSLSAYGVVGLNANRVVRAIATDHRDALADFAPTAAEPSWNPSIAQPGYGVLGPPAYPHYPAQYQGPAPPATNGLAIASLILSILWFFGLGSLLAVIFALVARSKIKASRDQERGEGLAIAGLVIGICGLIGSVGFFLILNATNQLHQQPVTQQSTVDALGVTVNVGSPSGAGVTEVLVQDVAYPISLSAGAFAIASVRVCAGTGGSTSGASSDAFRLGISGSRQVRSGSASGPQSGVQRAVTVRRRTPHRCRH